MLNLQNDNFCQIIIYYYINSSLSSTEELRITEKYNILTDIDNSLLFHLNTDIIE